MLDRHFKAVLDDATDGVLIERGDCVLYLNPAFAHILGYPSSSELTGAGINQIAHPEDLDRLRWFGACRLAGRPAPTRYSFRARKRHGEIVTLDASISVTKSGGEILITTIVRELQVAPQSIVQHVPGTQNLSAREKEVLERVLMGQRSKEIALQFNISEKTVFTHRSRAYRKLAVRSDRELFRLAADLGLI